MGGLSSMLGTAGGMNGSGVSAPTTANVVNPVTGQQTTDAYTAAQSGLDAQNSFMQALQQQQGIQNQSNVYSQLQGIANGTGPNPAQAQLAQATGANVANQAALMAGQRGSSQNTGMMARQAAQQGSAAQMNAAGQAANMQANQSMNALNSMGSLSTNQVGQQAAAVQGYSSGAQGEQSNLFNAINGVNNANVASQASLNQASGQLISASDKSQLGLVGGAGANMSFAKGGEVGKPHYDGGGPVQMGTMAQMPGPASSIAVAPQNQPGSGPASAFGKMLAGAAASANTGGAGGQVSDEMKGGQQIGALAGKALSAGYKYLMGKPAANGVPGQQGAQQGTDQGANGADQGAQGASDTSDAANGATDAANDAGNDAASGASDAGTDAAADAGSDAATQVASDAAADAATDAAADAGAGALGDAVALVAKGGEIKQRQHLDGGGMAGSILKMLPMAIAMLNEGGQVGGKAVPAMVSPGERYLPPRDVKKVAQGANPLAVGEKIPGKVKQKGDHYSNDTVPKTLQEGGVVIPKSVLESKNPHAESYKFVNAILAKKGHLPRKKAK